MRTTSSPAAGLLLVLLVTVPVRESARVAPEKARVTAKTATRRRMEEDELITVFKPTFKKMM
jgi:hypothetical protein